MSGDNGAEPVVIYRFADPSVTDTFDVPGCHCPAGIHKRETITYRTQLGAGEWESCNAVGLMAGDGEFIDYGASNSAAIAKSVESWTLLSNDECYHPGKPHKKHEPLGISRRVVDLLDETIRQAILERVKAAQTAFAAAVAAKAEDPADLPNGSGARSRSSSRASASPTPTTPPPA